MEELTSAMQSVDLNAKKRVRFCTSQHTKSSKRRRYSPEVEAKFYLLFGTDSDSDDEDLGPIFILDDPKPTVDEVTESLGRFTIGSNA